MYYFQFWIFLSEMEFLFFFFWIFIPETQNSLPDLFFQNVLFSIPNFHLWNKGHFQKFWNHVGCRFKSVGCRKHLPLFYLFLLILSIYLFLIQPHIFTFGLNSRLNLHIAFGWPLDLIGPFDPIDFPNVIRLLDPIRPFGLIEFIDPTGPFGPTSWYNKTSRANWTFWPNLMVQSVQLVNLVNTHLLLVILIR